MKPTVSVSEQVMAAAARLAKAVGRFQARPPVRWVYNPLDYAWRAHQQYIERFASGPKKVLFLGMNPGPFGMMQTGVPFGEVDAVRHWMGIEAPVAPPKNTHPKRPIDGFACPRSEVSGRRLWGLFAQRFGSAQYFFQDHFVANYCPLAFLDEGGRNLTPDKFPTAETESLFAACDAHLAEIVDILQPRWVVGVGEFALGRAIRAVGPSAAAAGTSELAPASTLKFGKILHPSPASPAANRNWAGTATGQLEALGIWS